MSHKKKQCPTHSPLATPTFRKAALTAISISLLTPTPAAFAQYKYKAYVKDLLTNGTTIVVPPQDQTGQLTITPTSYDFANTPKNSTSEAVFTAKNTSTTSSANITLGSPALSNTNGFSYIATCPAILAPQASCQIRVLFTPTDPSTFTSSLSFPLANATAPLPSSSIMGQGINSAITFSSNPLNFPDTDIATTSASQVLTITNVGSIRLPISSLSATAPYAISSNTCIDYLNPSQSCTATLTFSPTMVGPNPSLFSFNTATQTFTTSLAGNGLGPVIDIVPSAITGATTIDLTPNATATPQSVSPFALGTPSDPILNYKKLTSTTTLTNSGTKPLTNLDLSYSASSTSSPYISSTCTPTLPAGASCTVSISAYRHLKNKHTGFLTLSGNAIPTKQIPVSLDISPSTPTNTVVSDTSSYDFGAIVVRQPSTPKRVTFSYFGDSTATLTTPSSSILSLSNNTCENATLSPGDTCSVDVSLTPTSPRPNLFILWMPSYRIASAGPSPTPISHRLNYSGLGESLSLNPSSLSTTSTTTSSSSATYTLSNTGNRASTVSISHAPAATSPPFSLNATSSCSTIQPGTTCTITAVASANTEGEHTGSLTIDGSTSSPTFPTSLTVSDAPSLTLSSKSINFGTIISGASVSPQSVAVANIGASAANLGSLSTTSPFTLSHNCPSSLPALTTCSLSFGIDTSIAAPSTTAQLSSSLTLAASQPYFKTVSLSATHQGSIINDLGDLSLSPKSATFPYTPIGQQSYPKTFTITNANSAPFSLDISPTTIGADASQYTLSNNTCPSPLPANSSCTVDVSYAPTSPSLNTPQSTQLGILYEGALTLTSDLLASDIPVNALTFNPLNFNPSNPATGNNVQYYYYKNTSANPLTFSPQLQIGSHFTVLANTCSSIQPNASCKITVHAKTDTEGTFQDTMTANGTPITLNSTVFPFPSLNFSQYGNTITALDYGTVSHKKPLPTSNVQLNNASTSPATLSPITFISFSGISQTNTCSGTSNTTGTLCDFNINVSPSTIASPLNADSYKWSSTLNVSTADGLATTSLPIKGTAVVGTHSLPASIDFGTIYLGETATKTLSITNTSTNQAEISATSLSTGASDITHSTPCLNTWITPGQSCVSSLSMTPTTPGVRTGSISLGIIGKSNQPRTVPWTASVLTGFRTENILSPDSWAPNTTVGTPITQTVTFTNTYTQPLTVGSASPSGIPAGLTITSNTCSGQTIQPQATCSMTLQFSSAVAYEKATSSTYSFALSPVNQSVSLTIPSAYATLGDPTITSLKEADYPAGYALSTTSNSVIINGTGFAIGSLGTKIYANGTQITTTASTTPTDPFKGWRITYSSGATASTQITLTVPTGATVGDYTITAHNIGSPTDSTALLKVVDKVGVIEPFLVAQSATMALPTNTTNTIYYIYPPHSTPLTATLTFKNTGNMPASTLASPTSSAVAAAATITADTCTGKQLFLPTESCSVSFSTTSPATNGGTIQTTHTGMYSATYSKNITTNTGTYGSSITAAAVTPLNGFTAPSVTTSEIDFGPLTSSATRTATITVKNTSSHAPQVFTPTISGNSAFTLSSTTCSSTPLVPNATCTASITLSSPTLQGPISSTLTFGSDLQKDSSIILKADSIDPPLSAGIDTTAMSNYFPMTSTISAVGTSQLDPITDSPPVFALTRYDNCDGSATAPTLSLYQNNTPFHSNVPAHSTLDIQVTGGAYSCGIGYKNIDPNSNGRTLITGTTDFSISAWIGGGGSGHIYGQFQGTQPIASSPESKQTFAFYKEYTGRLCFKYGNGTSIAGGQLFCTTATAAAATTWAHVAATKTGQTISLYVNGVGQSFTASVPLDFSIYSGASIGTITNQPITDIGIFQRTLTPAEVQQVYSSKAPLREK